MKIAVCVKHVPEGVKRIDASSKRLDRSGEGALNAFDANAVEEALRLKEAAGGGEIVLVSLGPAKAQDALRKALAMGADRAVLISDDAVAGSDLVATSYALAKALERENADLAVEADRVGTDGSRPEVYALNAPPSRGESRKIDDDGTAAQQIVDFLAEKRLV